MTDDVYFDFKGWRFRPPFHCMRCGVVITARQWGFGRACGACDVGRPVRTVVDDGRCYAGPHELIDPFAQYFIETDRFAVPSMDPDRAWKEWAAKEAAHAAWQARYGPRRLSSIS